MSRYRKVDPRIWNDAKFRTLSNRGKLLFFMLLTHPGMTALGAMRGTPSGLAEELTWSPEAFREAFGEVLSRGMAEHDAEACLIALPNFIRYNLPESPNVIKAWVGALDLLPECDLKTAILHRAKAITEEMTEGFVKAFSEAFAQAMPNQKPKQKPKPKKDKAPPPPVPGGAFDRFWAAWPKHSRKVAKDQCRAKWAKRGCDAIADKIVAHVKEMKVGAAWTKDNGEFIPAPLVYLNQARWDAPVEPLDPEVIGGAKRGSFGPAAPNHTVPSRAAEETAEFLAKRADAQQAAFSPEAEAARLAALAKIKGKVPA